MAVEEKFAVPDIEVVTRVDHGIPDPREPVSMLLRDLRDLLATTPLSVGELGLTLVSARFPPSWSRSVRPPTASLTKAPAPARRLTASPDSSLRCRPGAERPW